MSKCCICKRETDSENAPILMMSGFGVPRYICPDCESAIDTASASCDPEIIADACRTLGEALTSGNTGDPAVIDEVNSIIAAASKRCEEIKNGSYRLSAEDKNAHTDGENCSENGAAETSAEEEEFELTEELLETEEDRLKDEHDARVAKVLDTVVSWAAGIMIVAAIVFFIIKFIF